MMRLHHRSFMIFVAHCVVSLRATTAFAAERFNILLIVSEDNGPEPGCDGDPFVKTTVLDKLAEGGVRFENAFVRQAGCSQSRYGLVGSNQSSLNNALRDLKSARNAVTRRGHGLSRV